MTTARRCLVHHGRDNPIDHVGQRCQDDTLASDLRIPRVLRNEADYSDHNLDSEVLANHVQFVIDLAGFIRRELQRLA